MIIQGFSCQGGGGSSQLLWNSEGKSLICCEQITCWDLGEGGGKNVFRVDKCPLPPLFPLNNPTSHVYLYTNLDSFSKLLSGTLFPEENVFPAAAAEEPADL